MFSHGRLRISVVIALVWIVLVFAGIDRWTSSSHHATLAALPGITAPEVTACAAAGLQYPYELLHAVHQRGQERVATKLRLPSERVQELVDASHLSEFRGIGLRTLPLLHAAGITRIEELADQESAAFTARLQHLSEASGVPPPYERQVRGWIDAAQRWTARHR